MLAHRDSLDSPGLADLSGTAALLELARIFRTRAPESEDEDAGAPAGPSWSAATCARRSCSSPRRAAAAAPPARARGRASRTPALIDGVLVLGDLASADVAQAMGRAVVQRPLAAAARLAAHGRGRRAPGGRRGSRRLARQRAVGAPGAAARRHRAGRGQPRRAARACCCRSAASAGRPATRASPASASPSSGAPRCAPSPRSTRPAGAARGGETRPPFEGEPDGIVTLRNVLPGLERAALVLCLLLPALLAALDAFFRAPPPPAARPARGSRWALAAGARSRWCGRGCACSASRARARRRAAPVLPADLALTTGQAAALASVALAVAGGVLLARPADAAGASARGNPAAGAAGAAVGAIVCAVALAVWVVNPYAAALLLPAAHLWLFLGAPQTRLRGALGWLALAAGLRRARARARRRDARARVGPLELARLWLVATAGGHVSAWSALAVGALAGCVAALVRILLARRRIAAVAPRRRGRARAGPATTPGRARSAAPSPRCAADMRRALRALSTVLIVAGVLRARRRRRDAAVAGAALRALRRRPAGRARRRARRARAHAADAGRAARAGPAPRPRAAGSPSRPARWPRARSRRPRRAAAGAGDRADTVVVEGTDAGELRKGRATTRTRRCPASAARSRSRATGRPTARRSGASTTSSAGDRIELRMPYGRFVYRVERTRIVAADRGLGDATGWRTIGSC